MARRLFLDVAILLLAVAAALAVRLFAFAIYSIPSESMLPGLRVGDYLLVAKWPYGWSGDAGPLARHLWRGRLRPRPPRRGDIVVFKAPPVGREDYVKRVIGLPGDRVALHRGVVLLNGTAVARERIAELVVPVTPNSPCRPAPGAAIRVGGTRAAPLCIYPRYRETLPADGGAGGASFTVLDLGAGDADEFGPATVPPGRLFVLGDNRDRSADSRFPAREGGGVGMVPQDALVGRPLMILVSTDGSARAWSPLSWLRALRAARLFAPL